MKNTEIGLSTSMINKLIIKDFNFNPMRLRQDTRLWIDLLNRGYTAYGLDEELVKYRIRRNQISGNKLKSAWRTLKLYLSITEIPIHMRMVNFCFYALNGIIKRLRS
jgi:teichuronic acid biosynthesis glycosyltransferase TuaG